MPSERSMPSEITGEKAARTKARSISLQTWIRPFWMTVKVTGSRFDMGYDYHSSSQIPRYAKRGEVSAYADEEVMEPRQFRSHPPAWLAQDPPCYKVGLSRLSLKS